MNVQLFIVSIHALAFSKSSPPVHEHNFTAIGKKLSSNSHNEAKHKLFGGEAATNLP